VQNLQAQCNRRANLIVASRWKPIGAALRDFSAEVKRSEAHGDG
jgi:hypothetical protein